MTGQEALTALYSGRLGTLERDGLSVRVLVLDARRDCGRLRLLVTPAQGTGERWVNEERVTLVPLVTGPDPRD